MDFLTFRKHLSSPPVFEGVAYLFSHIMCLYVLSSVMWCPLLLLHRNDIRFVFTSSCLWEGSCLINVVCACLCIVVSNPTQHILCLFLFCFSSVLFRLVLQYHPRIKLITTIYNWSELLLKVQSNIFNKYALWTFPIWF
jgi:hypothetical protein